MDKAGIFHFNLWQNVYNWRKSCHLSKSSRNLLTAAGVPVWTDLTRWTCFSSENFKAWDAIEMVTSWQLRGLDDLRNCLKTGYVSGTKFLCDRISLRWLTTILCISKLRNSQLQRWNSFHWTPSCLQPMVQGIVKTTPGCGACITCVGKW